MKNISRKHQKFQGRATPVGTRFKHLVVLGRSGTRTDGKPIWECQCDCGKVVKMISYNVTKGRTTSCGCGQSASTPVNHGLDYSSLEYKMWLKARTRAKNKTAFSIKPQDILIPDVCPILGLPLSKGKGHARDNSPSLDRKVPSKGYTPENIQVISYRANMLKNNATVHELELVLAHVKTL